MAEVTAFAISSQSNTTKHPLFHIHKTQLQVRGVLARDSALPYRAPTTISVQTPRPWLKVSLPRTFNFTTTPASMSYNQAPQTARSPPKVQPCRYKTGKTLGAGSYSVVKECVHIDTGRYYAAKVINKRLMAGREHMVSFRQRFGDCAELHRESAS